MGTRAGSAGRFVRPAPLVVLAVSWFAAFNLRAGFIGLGPALPSLTEDLGLSFAQASFLVAVPTLMMGLMAVPGGGGTSTGFVISTRMNAFLATGPKLSVANVEPVSELSVVHLLTLRLMRSISATLHDRQACAAR